MATRSSNSIGREATAGNTTRGVDSSRGEATSHEACVNPSVAKNWRAGDVGPPISRRETQYRLPREPTFSEICQQSTYARLVLQIRGLTSPARRQDCNHRVKNNAPGKSSRVPRALTPPGVLDGQNTRPSEKARPHAALAPRPKQAAVVSAGRRRRR